MIEAKQTHCGQYKPYGDFFRIWNVQTNLPQDEVVKWCFEKLYYGKVLPIHAEWRANIAYGAPHFSDPGYSVSIQCTAKYFHRDPVGLSLKHHLRSN